MKKSKTPAKDDELLTITQAAKIAGYDRSALRRVVLSGKLPATKVGSVWIVNQGDLDEWMKSDAYHSRGGRPRKEV